jgi:hypothetical protein
MTAVETDASTETTTTTTETTTTPMDVAHRVRVRVRRDGRGARAVEDLRRRMTISSRRANDRLTV